MFGYQEKLYLRSSAHYIPIIDNMANNFLANQKSVYGHAPIDLLPDYDVTQSTTLDFMHSVDLSVTARTISSWFKPSNHKTQFYISGKQKETLNACMH